MRTGKFNQTKFETASRAQVQAERELKTSFTREVRADRMGPNPGYKKAEPQKKYARKPASKMKSSGNAAPGLRPKGMPTARAKTPSKPLQDEFARRARLEAIHKRARAELNRSAGETHRSLISNSANKSFSR